MDAVDKKYRIAVIGTGVVANFLASFMLLQEDFELVWVAAQHLEHAQRFAESFFFRYATDDYRKIPAEDVDIVYVATWADKHTQITEYFLSRGVHVLCEKPYALTKDEYVRSQELAREHGVCFLVNLVTAYVPGFDRLEALLKQYGPVNRIEMSMGKQHTPDQSKLFTDTIFGGVYKDLSGYLFCFLARLFSGENADIRLTSELCGTGVDILSTVQVSYANGPDVSCVLTMKENASVAAVFYMERGTVTVEEFARMGRILLDQGCGKEVVYDAKHQLMGFEYVFDAMRSAVDADAGAVMAALDERMEKTTEGIERGLRDLEARKEKLE